ncbi:MAG: type II toxin-antitoxin system HipA family toxin [Alphaproteobacteria bacterium]|jgi:serine/threonine-protein kinase HipA|nr:type II toxin-antitoxin system HipA family toxin [Alphaproteobacteria bacterium]MBP9878360.1 type II toxin-antitoxin system HipA family toxin [Alphaproteobacteria bacterium]
MNPMLDVYLNNQLVGTLEQRKGGSLAFSYDSQFLTGAKSGISLSLPLQSEPFEEGPAKTFFSGLLPEEGVRDRLAAYLGLSKRNTFSLLEAIGGDCAGALALYPQDQRPENSKQEVETLDNIRLKEILDLIRRRPMLGGEDGYRLSLAGAQDKLAVGFANGQVLLIKGGGPTTHILKPMIEHVKDSAHNELFCMKLAKIAGIDVPDVSLHYVDDTPYYLVERYDRILHSNSTVTRIHQEDFCQASGIAPEMKYEREGGPSIAHCQHLIVNCAVRPAADQIKFLNMIIFNYLIGNADAHGKNFSLLYKNEKPELAPAYDLLSTTIYPDLSQKLAMKIGGQYKPQDIYLRHFYRLVSDTKTAQANLRKQINAMTQELYNSACELKESLAHKGISSPIFNDIIAIIQERSAKLSD